MLISGTGHWRRGMEEWKNGRMEEWKDGGMEGWRDPIKALMTFIDLEGCGPGCGPSQPRYVTRALPAGG